MPGRVRRMAAAASSPESSRPNCCVGRSTLSVVRGRAGERIQNVISVGMLSEGWDAKTVTHIMGLRAFTSQLLCEQVVGRGLRRTSYDVNPETGLFEPEHVNVFGVPFTFLPHEGREDGPPPPPKPKTAIEPVADREAAFSISWPNVVRVDHTYRPHLTLDMDRVAPLCLDAAQTAHLAEVAPTIDGKPDITKVDSIRLEDLARELRHPEDRLRDGARRVRPDGRELARGPGFPAGATRPARGAIHAIRQDQCHARFVRSRRSQAASRRLAEHDQGGAAHLGGNPTRERREDRARVRPGSADPRHGRHAGPGSRAGRAPPPPGATSTSASSTARGKRPTPSRWIMPRRWRRGSRTTISASRCSTLHRGVVRKFRPDFLVRLKSGDMLVLETKGRDTDQDRTKRRYLAEWVTAVNAHGGFGRWCWDVAMSPGEVHGILARHSRDRGARRLRSGLNPIGSEETLDAAADEPEHTPRQSTRPLSWNWK